MNSRKDLQEGEEKIEHFLTHLAVKCHVARSTKNQAMKALGFLYKKVLKTPLGGEINAVRAKKKINIRVVLTQDEVRQAIHLLQGPPD